MASLKSKSQIIREEIANVITHGVGLALSVAALVLLVVFASLKGDAWRIVSFSIFGASLVLLYLASTLYHGASRPQVKLRLNRFDHSAIYVLIAGTYTPFTLVTLRGAWGWTIFGIVWGLAIAGIVYKIFFYKVKYRAVSAIIYLLMGWIIVIAIKPLITSLSLPGLIWLAIGGLSYSFGVIFYLWKKLPFAHSIFHLFVLGGSISHFFAILLYV
jgi:hemolysin III